MRGIPCHLQSYLLPCVERVNIGTCADFSAAMGTLGLDFADEEIIALFARYDLTVSGFINYCQCLYFPRSPPSKHTYRT